MRYIKPCYYPRLAPMWKRLRRWTTVYEDQFAGHSAPLFETFSPDALGAGPKIRLAYTVKALKDLARMIPREGQRSKAVRFIAMKLGVAPRVAKDVYWQIRLLPRVVQFVQLDDSVCFKLRPDLDCFQTGDK